MILKHYFETHMLSILNFLRSSFETLCERNSVFFKVIPKILRISHSVLVRYGWFYHLYDVKSFLKVLERSELISFFEWLFDWSIFWKRALQNRWLWCSFSHIWYLGFRQTFFACLILRYMKQYLFCLTIR